MQYLKGFPYFDLEFSKEGVAHNAAQVGDFLQFIAGSDISDLFVISHGWNNDMKEARDLYARFFDCMRHLLDAGAVPGFEARKFAVMGVLWPSKKFADKELTASGAASAGSPITTALIRQELDDLKLFFDDPGADLVLEQAKELVPRLENSPEARGKFVDLLRSILPPETEKDIDGTDKFFELPGNEVIDRLSKPLPVALPQPGATGRAATTGGSAISRGEAVGIGHQFFSGIKSGALNLLNFITYYQMKERAGLVGSTGVNEVLRAIRETRPAVRLHLVGHSFGGRLVTAAVAGTQGQAPLQVHSLTLLQAAFSHYGFSERYDNTNNGFFRKVIAENAVSGPILISCTQNDFAVGKAYPIASRLAGQVAAALGDKNDKYGAIGRNGAQITPEASDGTLLKVGSDYSFEKGKIYNLNADSIIKDHSDICHNEVAYALLRAVESREV